MAETAKDPRSAQRRRADAIMLGADAVQLGKQHAIANGRGCHYWVKDFPGPISIKSVMNGKALWSTDDGHFHVSAQDLLVLNQGRRYSMLIESREPVETFCVFFKDGFVQEARRSLALTEEKLLDNYGNDGGDALELPEALSPKAGSSLAQLMTQMYRRLHRIPGGSMMELEDYFYLLAEELVREGETSRARIAGITAARAATREELHRRLQRARSFIDQCFCEELTVERMAAVACMALHHFHRHFTALFGLTPHQYLTARRLEKAQKLLKLTDSPVGLVCVEVGFESLGSFSALFKRKTGFSPEAFRTLKKQK